MPKRKRKAFNGVRELGTADRRYIQKMFRDHGQHIDEKELRRGREKSGPGFHVDNQIPGYSVKVKYHRVPIVFPDLAPHLGMVWVLRRAHYTCRSIAEFTRRNLSKDGVSRRYIRVEKHRK